MGLKAIENFGDSVLVCLELNADNNQNPVKN